jgi:hypothetical protein
MTVYSVGLHELLQNLMAAQTSSTEYPAGLLVLVVCRNRFYLWGVREQDLLCNQALPENIADAAFTADGSGIVVVGVHYLSVWSISRCQTSGEVCRMLSLRHAHHAMPLLYSFHPQMPVQHTARDTSVVLAPGIHSFDTTWLSRM